ncbi:MAG TPA: serine hydrolase, partial [Pyrinomonadaceae bacterium]|nr:serine hydrolase [Pyrinomonadaceae bacterium]
NWTGHSMRSEVISTFLQERIVGGDFPSAVYLVAEKGEIVFQDARGYAVVEPEMIPATIDTIYDLASLTKPLVTGLLLAKLIDCGIIGLYDLVGNHLGAFYTEQKSEITLKDLATHTSGLRTWLPFYLLVDQNDPGAPKSTVMCEICSDSPVEPVGSIVVYSDLNFLALAFLVEAATEATLSERAHSEIIGPLELTKTQFNPPSTLRRKIAASEFGNLYEMQTCNRLGYFGGDERDWKLAREVGRDVFAHRWRDYQIWGEVHDGNAYYLEGVAGHAGLFGTTEEVFKIAQQFLPDYTTLLKPETCALFRTNFTAGMNEDRSFAFQLASTPESTAGTRMSPESFGHLGFTGTSLWIDPIKERVFILLTNRTHARKLPFANINSVRRRFHDLAVELLDNR